MGYTIKTSELTKIYSKKAAVNKVNLEIQKGDIYGFVGRNGAGKTTTMKMIVGLERPSSGNIELFEDNDVNKGRAKIGTVIEYPALYPYMTARQNLEAQRMLLNIKDKSVTNEILETVGLSNTGNKKAKNFSLGMKQRLAIALALMGDPEFLLLDEPINGLDPIGIKEIRDLILKLNKERGITIMVSSHIIGELSKIANRYGVINNGELVGQFEADELKNKLGEKIEVKVNDPVRAYDFISSEFGEDKVILDDEGNVISVYEDESRINDINKILADNDIIVESIRKVGGDYEEYFINLMGGNRND